MKSLTNTASAGTLALGALATTLGLASTAEVQHRQVLVLSGYHHIRLNTRKGTQ